MILAGQHLKTYAQCLLGIGLGSSLLLMVIAGNFDPAAFFFFARPFQAPSHPLTGVVAAVLLALMATPFIWRYRITIAIGIFAEIALVFYSLIMETAGA